MKTNIITELPLWFIVFCFALAVLYSFILYYKDKKLESLSKQKLIILSTSRFLAVFIMSILLLSPILQIFKNTIEKPIIIFAQDNSQSMLSGTKGDDSLKHFTTKMTGLIDELNKDFDIKFYTFGDRLTENNGIKFDEKHTDFSNLFNEISDRYYNRNVGALIITSDGIYNKGTSPVFESANIKFPVYTVAMGDTSQKKDIFISKLRHNQIAFLGNRFPVEIEVTAKKLPNTITTIKVFHEQKTIFSKELKISGNDLTENITIEIEAIKPGIQHYNIEISPITGEENITNNNQQFAIDIIDGKQKILIVGNAPHPDIGAIIKALDLNKNFQVEYTTTDKINKPIEAYSLLILYQLPSITNAASNLLSKIAKNNTPILFILGSRSHIQGFNNLKTGLTIQQQRSAFDDAQIAFNQNFSIFEITDEDKIALKEAPPLLVPFGNYTLTGNIKTVFNQKIKGISTEKPLILINPENSGLIGKCAIICGEGIWRWRMENYQKTQNHNSFDQILNKIIQYLALKVNKDKFIVTTNKLVNENNPLVFEAEIYNDTYELINKEDVDLEIINSNNKTFKYVMNKTEKSYYLNAGIFPIGEYEYIATTKINEKKITKSGKISVVPVNVEKMNTIANHQMLYQLADKNRGKMFYPNNLDSLKLELTNHPEIVPISHSEKTLNEAINLKWIFFFILFLLTLEWFLRKYFGAY